jgi:glycosyltransferase involved in cell wall biosynthesis
MKIAFYNHGIAFDGSTPFQQPLGGSETSIIHMARELVNCGHNVSVYANCPRPDNYDGVTYHHYHDFFTEYLSMPWDVVISFRSFDPFLLGRVAPRTIYWTGDAFDQPNLKNFGHPSLQDSIDLVFCVSDWQRQTFIEKFNLVPEKVIATRNGFFPRLIPQGKKKEWNRAAYSSTPYRGLDILLKIFPEIRRQVPDLSLDVFSSMKVYGVSSEEDRRQFGALYKAAAQPGVTLHGSVAQPVLLEYLSRTGLFLYPNTFDETSCMAAIEAQAAGCVVVTSAKAGLNETVEHGRTGILLKGDPQSAVYQDEFVRTVCELVRLPELLKRFSDAAVERAFQKYTWASIASEWTTIIENMAITVVHPRWSGPLGLLQRGHEFLENGNVRAASRVLTALDKTPFMRNEVEEFKGKLNTWM